jgi:hypothetical protein
LFHSVLREKLRSGLVCGVGSVDYVELWCYVEPAPYVWAYNDTPLHAASEE